MKLLKDLLEQAGEGTHDNSTQHTSNLSPVIGFESKALITSNKSTFQQLDKCQNNSLRLIYKAVKNNPKAAIQLHTGNQPIKEEIKQLAPSIYLKLQGLPHKTWVKTVSKTNVLKTEKNLIAAILNYLKENILPLHTELYIPSINPADLLQINSILSLI